MADLSGANLDPNVQENSGGFTVEAEMTMTAFTMNKSGEVTDESVKESS